jgi:hypothetical protein
MDLVTGAEITTLALGDKTPSASETAFASVCASAVNAAITEALGSNVSKIITGGYGWSELVLAARLAGVEAFKRKETPFGVTGFADMQGGAIRVAKDYLEGVRPIIDRYRSGPGIG